MPNSAAFADLLQLHQADLRGFLSATVADCHAREDLFQEVCRTLWQTFDRYDSARPFGAWMRGVATRKLQEARRRDARFPLVFSHETLMILAEASEPSPRGDDRRALALRYCLAELPPKSREIVGLHYEQGLKGKEIAGRLAMSIDSVHQALSRVRARLALCVRKRLASGLDEPGDFHPDAETHQAHSHD